MLPAFLVFYLPSGACDFSLIPEYILCTALLVADHTLAKGRHHQETDGWLWWVLLVHYSDYDVQCAGSFRILMTGMHSHSHSNLCISFFDGCTRSEIVLLCCLVHFFIVSESIVTGGSEATAPLAEFNNVFDPAGDPQKAFMGMTSSYPNFVAEVRRSHHYIHATHFFHASSVLLLFSLHI
jgi:hypothetical protein